MSAPDWDSCPNRSSGAPEPERNRAKTGSDFENEVDEEDETSEIDKTTNSFSFTETSINAVFCFNFWNESFEYDLFSVKSINLWSVLHEEMN